jgi:polyphosphate kinase
MKFFNRDISWLGFNHRVLTQAANKSLPLFERLKFLSIFSSNLNEFFRVRYPEAMALSVLGKKTKKNIDNYDKDNISTIKEIIENQLLLFGDILCGQIIPELKLNGIIFYYDTPILPNHLPEVREIFLAKVLSFIQPIYLDGDTEKKFLPENNKLYFLITLKEKEEGDLKQAIVNIPSDKINRFFVLSPVDDYEYVIFIDDVVRENMAHIFPNQSVQGIYSIKINRDAELNLEDEFSGDLLKKITKQLKKRDFGPPSRLLYENTMPTNIQMFLESTFNLSSDEMFEGGRYHNLDDLSQLPSFGKDLFYKKIKPLKLPLIMNSGDIFKAIAQQDILIHVPYQTYNPVLSFFNQAAVDINVTEIYITLYRVAQESHIINALISAARNGKRVVAFIELKARFDEENNIKWSKEMKEAGVKIIYSIPEIKVHSKIALVKRKSDEGNENFSIIATGNFNEVTAQFYTDHVLMSADKKIAGELLQLFKFLEHRNEIDQSKKLKFSILLVSQFNMVPRLLSLIDKEIKNAQKGLPALIRIKVNNLEEKEIILKLYEAALAGVEVQLLVRGINCLVPEQPGMVGQIKVKRIVDRYLEHSRILIFGHDENATIFLGSADLMTRNLRHRIEVFVTVKDQSCRQQLLSYFDIQWKDNNSAVLLLPDYVQVPESCDELPPINAQKSIYDFLSKNIT